MFQLIPFTRETGSSVWNMKFFDIQTLRKRLRKIMVFFFHLKKNADFFNLYVCGTLGNRNAPQCLVFQREVLVT